MCIYMSKRAAHPGSHVLYHPSIGKPQANLYEWLGITAESTVKLANHRPAFKELKIATYGEEIS
jgi:hypothetical protein